MTPCAAQIRYSIFSGLLGSEDGRVGCKYNFLSNTQALRLATKISSSLTGLFQRHRLISHVLCGQLQELQAEWMDGAGRCDYLKTDTAEKPF